MKSYPMKSIACLVFVCVTSLCSLNKAFALEPGFIPLLDRDHTDGWEQCGPGRMEIKDGISTNSSPAKWGVAIYNKRMFADFVIKAEFRGLQREFNSGVWLRISEPNGDILKAVESRYEVGIFQPTKERGKFSGSIWGEQPAFFDAVKANDWNEFEITVTGQHYLVKLNGQTVNDFTGRKNTSGYIGLESNAGGPVQFRNVRIKDLSAAAQQLPIAPTAALTLDPNQPLLDTFSQLAPNASAWVLAGLDEGVPPNVRQNLTYIREDLLDEYKQKPKASQDAYKLAHQLCSTMISALDERDQTLVRAGFRAVQADAGISGTNQALQARRNYMMSWPQYAREQAQRAELIRQGTAGAQVNKALPKVEWSNRTAALRKTLDDLYAKFREELRQSAK